MIRIKKPGGQKFENYRGKGQNRIIDRTIIKSVGKFCKGNTSLFIRKRNGKH